MIVVADTSPLNYLVLLGKVYLLNEIYAHVLIPPAVLSELCHSGAPKQVRNWAFDLPDWAQLSSEVAVDPTLPRTLGPGECEAISLAMSVSATFVLLDVVLPGEKLSADHSSRRERLRFSFRRLSGGSSICRHVCAS